MAQPINRYRSANGLPGPDYWQNRADYQLRVTLDPDHKLPDADRGNNAASVAG